VDNALHGSTAQPETGGEAGQEQDDEQDMEQDEESEDDEEEEEDEDDGLEILMNAPQRSMDFRQVSQSSSPLDLTAFRSGSLERLIRNTRR